MNFNNCLRTLFCRPPPGDCRTVEYGNSVLQNYKKNKKFAMGMSLKFNPSLCNDEKTNKLCRNVLRNASFRLRDIMLEGVSTKIVNLTSERTNLVRSVKENSTVEDLI